MFSLVCIIVNWLKYEKINYKFNLNIAKNVINKTITFVWINIGTSMLGCTTKYNFYKKITLSNILNYFSVHKIMYVNLT